MDKTPFVLEETEDYAVVFKPPKMHSAVLKQKDDCIKNGGSLQEWYASLTYGTHYPDFCEMMHRLDYETHGLVLFSKNLKSFEFFKNLQEKGEFIKEYSAVINSGFTETDGGFPQPPVFTNCCPSIENPMIIESYFRPYGKGRKLVRPVIEIKKKQETAKDRGGFYRTEIISISGNNFTVRIKRGFRHQIRCHLCWIGFPILNDPLYSNLPADTDIKSCQFLALRAHALFFNDPSNGNKREYRIDALEKMPF